MTLAFDDIPAVNPDASTRTVMLGGSLGSTRSMWAPQIEALSSCARVISYDVRGHGESGLPDGAFTITDLAQDVVDLMDHLDIDTADFVGLSIGGMIAMTTAIEHPQRVSSLALLCTSAYVGPANTWTDRAALARESGTSALAPAVVSRWLTTDFASTHQSDVDFIIDMVASTDDEAYARCCEAIATYDLRERLREINVPTLIVAGAQDPSMPVADHAAVLHSGIAGSRLEVIDPGAHLVSYERPDALNPLLVDWLKH